MLYFWLFYFLIFFTMKDLWKIILTTVLTAIIVGGGVYFWANGEIDSLRDEISSMQDGTETVENEDRSYDDMWLSFGELSFYLPEEWSEAQAVEEDSSSKKIAYIEVPDSEYDVQLKMTMTEDASYDENLEPIAQQYEAKVYQLACGGAYACYTLVFLDEYVSEIAFQVESDEEPPENLDAPWSASTEVTSNELEQFLLSVALTAE